MTINPSVPRMAQHFTSLCRRVLVTDFDYDYKRRRGRCCGVLAPCQPTQAPNMVHPTRDCGGFAPFLHTRQPHVSQIHRSWAPPQGSRLAQRQLCRRVPQKMTFRWDFLVAGLSLHPRQVYASCLVQEPTCPVDQPFSVSQHDSFGVCAETLLQGHLEPNHINVHEDAW